MIETLKNSFCVAGHHFPGPAWSRFVCLKHTAPAMILLCLMTALQSGPLASVRTLATSPSGVTIEFALAPEDAAYPPLEEGGKDPRTGEYFQFAALGIPCQSKLRMKLQEAEWVKAPSGLRGGDSPNGGRIRETGRGNLRHQCVAGIAFYPFRRFNGEWQYARRARVALRWSAPGRTKRISGPTKRESPAEKGFRSFLVNAEQARAFRTAGYAKRLNRTSTAPEIRVKIKVSKKGMYRVSCEELREQGVPVNALDPNTFRLSNRGKELLIWVEGAHDHRFDAEDEILFFGEPPAGPHSQFSPYTFTNVYWLTWGGRLGARYAVQSVAPRFDPESREYGRDVDEAPPFRDTIHVEFDNRVRFLGSVGAVENFSLDTMTSLNTDLWYWEVLGNKDHTSIPFSVPSPYSKGGEATMRIHLHGLSDRAAAIDHRLQVFLQGKRIPGAEEDLAEWGGQTDYVFESAPFNNGLLSSNEDLELVMEKVGDSVDVSTLNWIEMDYIRERKAEDDICYFRSGDASVKGLLKFTVKGFQESQLSLWGLDGRKLEGFHVHSDEDDGEVMTFHDSITSPVRFLALAETQYLSVDTLLLDTSRNLQSSHHVADLVILTHAAFKDSLADLVSLRTSQGYEVLVVDVEDVYDEFNAGVMNPVAIKRFLAHATTEWTRAPWALLIVGDATHDYDKQNRERNFVPTHLSVVPRWGPSANDDWFTTVAGEDVFPDLLVGRLPVSNGDELRAVIGKIHKSETSLLRREWRDRVLLVGGLESSFTRINDHLSGKTIGEKFHQIRIDTDPESPYFYGGQSNTRLRNALESGVSLVSFSGHGGGNVWSDGNIFGLEDVKRLRNPDKAPIVLSFTCLTGFFESVNYPSLGEDLVRRKDGGALCFYGASAYVDPIADERLTHEVVHEIISGESRTVGEAIRKAELKTLLKYGDVHSIITRQYNLLGDPLSSLQWPKEDVAVACPNPHVLQGESLQVGIRIPRFASGYARIGAYDGPHRLQSRVLPFDTDTFSVGFAFKPRQTVRKGVVRVYAWTDTSDAVGFLPFSHNALRMGSVSLSQSELSPGDSVRIRASVYDHSDDALTALRGFYGLGLNASNTAYSQVAMERISGNDTLWESVRAVRIPGHADAVSEFYVKFQGRSTGGWLESDAFEFPLKPMPDVAPVEARPLYLTGIDPLHCIVRIVNKGEVASPATPVQLRMSSDTGSTQVLGVDTLSQGILPGKTDSVVFTLPEIHGKVTLQGIVNPFRDFDEVSRANNATELRAEINRRKLSDKGDTLFSLDGNAALHPVAFSGPCWASLVTGDSTGRPSRSQGMVYAVLQNDTGGPVYNARLARVDSQTAGVFFLLDTGKTFETARSLLPEGAQADDHVGAYRWRESIGRWIWQAGQRDGNRLGITDSVFSEFCAGIRYDVAGPRIEISSRGRPLVFTDYVSIGHTIDFHIKDDAGIDMSTLEVRCNGEAPDTTHFSKTYANSSPEVLVANFLPVAQGGLDSLVVRVADVNGNQSEKRIAYLLGEELEIKFLANYPNPFSDKTQIIYTVTDACDRAKIEVFTLAGRPIRSWDLIEEFGPNMIGYHELEWNGRDFEGHQVANGTYYLKLSVWGKGGKRQKISPAVKLQGFPLQ